MIQGLRQDPKLRFTALAKTGSNLTKQTDFKVKGKTSDPLSAYCLPHAFIYNRH
jgi:hypothetical protein